MPRKSDSMTIKNEKLDKRVKLTQQQKLEIIEEYKTGNIGMLKLAGKYGVSKRTIQFIITPEKLVENKKRREERGGWKQYHDKEKHNAYQKKHRDYKNELAKNNLIGQGENKHE